MLPVPTEQGKGVLVSSTSYGNVGPELAKNLNMVVLERESEPEAFRGTAITPATASAIC